jgi:hypothetical protein
MSYWPMVDLTPVIQENRQIYERVQPQSDRSKRADGPQKSMNDVPFNWILISVDLRNVHGGKIIELYSTVHPIALTLL